MELLICSVMAIPAHVLDRLPPALRKNSLIFSADRLDTESEGPKWSEALVSGDWPRGGVIEVAVRGGQGLGTTASLKVCQHAQEQGKALTGRAELCGFVDPGASLHAPGVRALGIDLSRLLVVQPRLNDVARTAVRMVESQIFSVVVIDTGALETNVTMSDLGPWVRVVRRMSLALEGTSSVVILLTELTQRRTIPLPVLHRIELSRPNLRELEVRVERGQKEPRAGSFRLPWQTEERRVA
jgi:recombination protein RecA